MSMFFSGGLSGDDSVRPRPDPTTYNMCEYKQIGNNLLVKVQYKDVDNFEGNKILLFQDTQCHDVRGKAHLDPHFLESNKLIARFRPNDLGWNCGVALARSLEEVSKSGRIHSVPFFFAKDGDCIRDLDSGKQFLIKELKEKE